MHRRLVTAFAVALGLGAVGFAALPFTGSTNWDLPAWSDEPQLDTTREYGVRGRCGPAVVSAWQQPTDDEVKLWAVTVGSGARGEASGTLGSDCRHDARTRLLWSGGLAIGAAGVTVVRRRSGPPSDADPADPA